MNSLSAHGRLLRRSPALRSGLLFVNFFLILLAYYQIKPASRSLFLEYMDANRLPYIWIGSAILLASLMPFYRMLVMRFSRLRVVIGSCAVYIAILLGFKQWADAGGAAALAVALYAFADIFGVVLLEQFWSLTNSTYRTDEGKRWYGLVGSGALLGGLVGGSLSAWLVSADNFTTTDLLYTASAFIAVIMVLTAVLIRLGIYYETDVTSDSHASDDGEPPTRQAAMAGWRAIFSSPYLMMIAGVLLLAQFAQPIVDYLFLDYVQENFTVEDERTGFISLVNSLLGGVALGVNVVVTPLMHHFVGAIGGLLVQPVLLCGAALAFLQAPSIALSVSMKIVDRSLSYSINRASKELLYVPIRADLIYRAKAWIDMVGYRVFKLLGAAVVLLFTTDRLIVLADSKLAGVVVLICLVWIGVLLWLRRYYRRLLKKEDGSIGLKKLSPEESSA